MNRPKAQATKQVETERLIVTRWDFAPGEETGHHVHEHDYVVVPLMDGSLQAETDEGVKSAEMKTGQSYARPKGVTHNIVNPGPGRMAFVEIEIKK